MNLDSEDQARVRVETDRNEPALVIDDDLTIRLRTLVTNRINGSRETVEGDDLEVNRVREPDGTSWVVETPDGLPDVEIAPEVV